MSSFGIELPSGRAYAPRTSLFARFVKAIYDSRMRRAQEIIAQHRHLLPTELEAAGRQLHGRNDDRLPFLK
jgi:predicted transcriptional regulator